MKAVVLACAGASLLDTDVFSPGHPVCAISTAIQTIHEPNIWAFIDRPFSSVGLGRERGLAALANPRVQKVFPIQRNKSDQIKQYPNVTLVPYDGHRDESEHRRFMDAGKLLRACHNSLCFAVQYFCREGYDTLIFAGNDLRSALEKPRSWDSPRPMEPKTLNYYNRDHDVCLETLRAWHPIAQAKGIRWLSWTPVSRINDFMPTYIPE